MRLIKFKNMRKIIVLLLFIGILGVVPCMAQSLTPTVISSFGGYFSNTSGSLSATVAEMTMVESFNSAGIFLTQGFQQPEEWYASVNEEPQSDGTISIYPNPSNGKFSITINSPENGSAQIYLYDMLGQKTLSMQMNIATGLNNENIDIQRYAMGIYFLKYLYTGDNGEKKSEVIKINLVH